MRKTNQIQSKRKTRANAMINKQIHLKKIMR